MVGTSGYTAPEVLLGEGSRAASDVFSFAVVAWELFLEPYQPVNPFAGLSVEETLARVREGARPVCGNSHPWEIRALVEDMWPTSPEARVSMLVVSSAIMSAEPARVRVLSPVPSPAHRVESTDLLPLDLESLSTARALSVDGAPPTERATLIVEKEKEKHLPPLEQPVSQEPGPSLGPDGSSSPIDPSLYRSGEGGHDFVIPPKFPRHSVITSHPRRMTQRLVQPSRK